MFRERIKDTKQHEEIKLKQKKRKMFHAGKVERVGNLKKWSHVAHTIYVFRAIGACIIDLCFYLKMRNMRLLQLRCIQWFIVLISNTIFARPVTIN